MSMCSDHVYKVGFWVEMSIRMNYFAILQCNTDISHHRGMNNYLTVLTGIQFCLKNQAKQTDGVIV